MPGVTAFYRGSDAPPLRALPHWPRHARDHTLSGRTGAPDEIGVGSAARMTLVDLAQVSAVWLHSVATVVLLGYYAVMALIVIPVLRATLKESALGRIIPDIERRALPLVLGAVGVFLLTGLYLLLSDDRYLGLGHVIDNTWSIVMLVKHVVVIALVAIGVWLDVVVVRDIALPADEPGRATAVHRLAVGTTAIVVLAAIVLLLTATAQAS